MNLNTLASYRPEQRLTTESLKSERRIVSKLKTEGSMPSQRDVVLMPEEKISQSQRLMSKHLKKFKIRYDRIQHRKEVERLYLTNSFSSKFNEYVR